MEIKIVESHQYTGEEVPTVVVCVATYKSRDLLAQGQIKEAATQAVPAFSEWEYAGSSDCRCPHAGRLYNHTHIHMTMKGKKK